jgi:Zn-dependent protease
MLPILPLDGGRVLLSVLPTPIAGAFARSERYGMLLILGLLFLLPMILENLGLQANIFSEILAVPTKTIIQIIFQLVGMGGGFIID